MTTTHHIENPRGAGELTAAELASVNGGVLPGYAVFLAGALASYMAEKVMDDVGVGDSVNPFGSNSPLRPKR